MHAYEKVSQARTAVVPKVQNSGGLRSRFCNTNEGGAGVVACHAAESIFKPSSMIPLIDIAIYLHPHARRVFYAIRVQGCRPPRAHQILYNARFKQTPFTQVRTAPSIPYVCFTHSHCPPSIFLRLLVDNVVSPQPAAHTVARSYVMMRSVMYDV